MKAEFENEKCDYIFFEIKCQEKNAKKYKKCKNLQKKFYLVTFRLFFARNFCIFYENSQTSIYHFKILLFINHTMEQKYARRISRETQ
ncbi:hypothetical protein CQA58_02530 [Helicobacter brantae]|uniref:Uncharacterized protein n=1 Tax=Helicobacter brantae TaxID=375927 RepID=A0A3D8J236_9HELI|nr:hypothetical protein CQA58_02530 [Helicobacter brantae]